MACTSLDCGSLGGCALEGRSKCPRPATTISAVLGGSRAHMADSMAATGAERRGGNQSLALLRWQHRLMADSFSQPRQYTVSLRLQRRSPA